ncbi:MAG: hypothetical protein PWQ46_207 [Methanomicrobiaceae archaeon]|nr:hypothetical protein [Methanomicrobiaceae archaeon]
MTTNTITPGPASRLWMAVPAVSFGGIGVGLLLMEVVEFSYGFWAGIAGCVIASCLLFYQAYSKPRRDLVSLFTPLYAVLIFLLPNEVGSMVIVQVVFAATISLLSVRVEKLFNVKKTEKKTMKQMLNEYIMRIEPLLSRVDEETGHLVAQALLRFKFGLYESATDNCNKALDRLKAIEPYPGVLEHALLILRERASGLAISRVVTYPEHVFTEEDSEYLAIHLPENLIDDPATLDLDNTLILLYAVGIETSPLDEQALEEHQRFIIQILESYKEKLAKAAAT